METKYNQEWFEDVFNNLDTKTDLRIMESLSILWVKRYTPIITIQT